MSHQALTGILDTVVVQARYSSDSARNGILRAALFDAWDRRCYFCRRWYDVAVMEIDHLIPRSYRQNSKRLKKTLLECLPVELAELPFDIDAPHNLAPICRDCNNDKRDDSFEGSMKFTRLLEKARKREPEVVKLFRAFEDKHDLAKALLTVTVAEIADSKAKETLMEFGSLMVNRLRVVAPDVLETPSDYPLDDPSGDQMHHVIVTLNQPGRRAQVILEDVYGCDFDDALRYPGRAVVNAINDQLRLSMHSYLFQGGEADADIESPSGRVVVEVAELAYVSPEEFRLSGRFEADGASVAAIHASTDSGTAWVQVDATAAGAFELYFAPDDEDVDPGTVSLTTTDSDTWCDDPLWKEESDYGDDFDWEGECRRT
ncbi:HNH endonuclease [[Mycobacterium] vasticus]|uniref:HNH endonuclease signature motif containing protein n=1 Tax=[Mycobacterium] vasticus TaxID=2875777 RepID=A0ABU5Z3V6_9MYCO|nr:HNH endonuclease signature motif containing protein [Mycolicibacter sp. MYC017]MEB3072081.1 HNH endonuclease signature motif containing protein [Mycolicibacter sp. MYC017]